MITEPQMQQALEVVLRDLAQTIIRALPQHVQQDPMNSQTSIALGKVLADGRLLLTVGDAAAMLSVSRSALYRLIMEGQVRSIKVGKVRRIPVSALQEFITREMGDSM